MPEFELCQEEQDSKAVAVAGEELGPVYDAEVGHFRLVPVTTEQTIGAQSSFLEPGMDRAPQRSMPMPLHPMPKKVCTMLPMDTKDAPAASLEAAVMEHAPQRSMPMPCSAASLEAAAMHHASQGSMSMPEVNDEKDQVIIDQLKKAVGWFLLGHEEEEEDS